MKVEQPTEAELRAGLRKATIAQKIFPVVCGTAFKNKGIQNMLDSVVDLLPSPLDVPNVQGTDVDDKEKVLERRSADDEPFSALVFKIMTDPFVGQLAFVRVYSGKLVAGESVFNVAKGRKERIGRLVKMHANKREEVTEVLAGDIAAAVGLKSVSTGDTICDEKSPIILESIDFPAPVIQLAIEPKTKVDQERLGMAIAKLAQEDPTLKVSTDPDTGQTILAGMGELHLEIIVDRMFREFSVGANVGKPQVAYRETIRQMAEYDYTHKKQTGGSGQYARVKLRVEPNPGKQYEFENDIRGGNIPKEFIPAIQKGVIETLEHGVLAGYPALGYQGLRIRRRVSRCRLVGNGVQDLRFDLFEGSREESQAGAARACDEGRSCRAGRVHGFGQRRFDFAPRPFGRHGNFGLHACDQSDGASLGNVRLRNRTAFAYARPRCVYHALRAVRRSTEIDRGRDYHARSREERGIEGTRETDNGERKI